MRNTDAALPLLDAPMGEVLVALSTPGREPDRDESGVGFASAQEVRGIYDRLVEAVREARGGDGGPERAARQPVGAD